MTYKLVETYQGIQCYGIRLYSAGYPDKVYDYWWRVCYSPAQLVEFIRTADTFGYKRREDWLEDVDSYCRKYIEKCMEEGKC